MIRTALFATALFMPLALLAACKDRDQAQQPEPAWFAMANTNLPAMRWGLQPSGKLWTRSTMQALLAGDGGPLIDLVPADIAEWCPAYAANGDRERAAFWTGLLSALAKHESTYNERAVGGGGKWFGLVQISPATARHYGCAASTGGRLKNGVNNLQCAVRIMAVTVPRDGVVAAGGRGVAADWAPFKVAAKRADMMNWTAEQDFCR